MASTVYETEISLGGIPIPKVIDTFILLYLSNDLKQKELTFRDDEFKSLIFFPV